MNFKKRDTEKLRKLISRKNENNRSIVNPPYLFEREGGKKRKRNKARGIMFKLCIISPMLDRQISISINEQKCYKQAHCSLEEEDQEAIHKRWGRERLCNGCRSHTQFRHEARRVKYPFIAPPVGKNN